MATPTSRIERSLHRNVSAQFLLYDSGIERFQIMRKWTLIGADPLSHVRPSKRPKDDRQKVFPGP
jgi:hypothetical protein